MAVLYSYLDPGILASGDMSLKLKCYQKVIEMNRWVMAYKFNIMVGDKHAGKFELRLGKPEWLLYGGNIGYEVFPDFRGMKLSKLAVELIIPYAKTHGLDELWINCHPDNEASIRIIQLLEAEFVEVVPLPPELDKDNEKVRCRYKLAI